METISVYINRWIDKKYVTHTCNGILLGHKKNAILPFAATWIDLEDITLSEMSDKEKHSIILLVCGIWKLQWTSDYNMKEADPEI